MMTGRNYRIRVEGYLEPAWLQWFDGLAMVHQPNGETEITALTLDQAALYGLLSQLGNLGLVLVAVNRELDQPHPPASTQLSVGEGGRSANPLDDR